MTEIEAIQALQIQPLEFLKKYSFTPYSSGAIAGNHMFYMVDTGDQKRRPDSILGRHSLHTTQRFSARANALFGGAPFNAWNIPVQNSDIAINPFLLPLNGSGIMLTTQLTGCSVVIIPSGDSFNVAHLQPTGETGAQLKLRLTQPGIEIYGQPDYVGGRALVAGVRLNGVWGFYAQKQDVNFNVLSAKKIA